MKENKNLRRRTFSGLKVAFVLFISTAFLPTVAYSQAGQSQIGSGIGLLTYTGDTHPNFSLDTPGLLGRYFYRIHASNIVVFKLSIALGIVEGRDSNMTNSFRQTRNFDFSTFIGMADLSLEYHFFNYNSKRPKILNPYLQLGVGALRFMPRLKTGQQTIISETDLVGYSPVIPVGIGVKHIFAKYLELSVQAGIVFTFTNGLDGIEYSQDFSKFRNSNRVAADQLQFFEVSLSYSFFELYCPDHYLF